MNTKEINMIQKTYILLWRTNLNCDFIHVGELMVLFSKNSNPFFKLFFHSNTIDYNDYFIFVCIMLFFSPEQIFEICLIRRKMDNLCITHV